MSNLTIELKNISKVYIDEFGNKLEVLKNVNASFSKNKIYAVLAPEGSGKSTVLKIISGIETHSNGELITNNQRIVFIPSEPSSFPWLNVRDNVKEGLKVDLKELQSIINKVGLSGYEDHFPDNKSYGFRFRISLAKALAYKADFIVLDAVFNMMSAESKLECFSLIKKLNSEGQSFILGTSNITEALFLASEIYFLSSKPAEIINKYESAFSKENDISVTSGDNFIKSRNEIENIFKKEYSQIFAKLTI